MTLRNKKANDWKKIIALIIFGIFVSLVICEGVVRLIEPKNDTKGIKLSNSNRFYGYKGNSLGYAGGIKFRTNSSGFRTTEFKNINVERDDVIVVLGDSYSFGYGVRDEDSFPKILENKLRLYYNNSHIKVVNLSMPGYNTYQEFYTLKEFSESIKPKLILIGYHLNDIHPYRGETPSNNKNIFSPLYTIKQHIHLFRFILPRIAAIARYLGVNITTSATEEIMEYVGDGQEWRQNKVILDELYKYCKQINARMGVVILPYIVMLNKKHPCSEAYNVVQYYFKSNDIPVINSFEYFLGLDAFKLWIHPFDGHPNAQGHALIANASFDLIVSENLLK